MDLEYFKRQKAELERLLNPKLVENELIKKIGFSLVPDQLAAARIDCDVFKDLHRKPTDPKKLLARIKELEAENKSLKQQLAMQVLRYEVKSK